MTSPSGSYELLFQCYVSGQMSDSQMHEHLRGDEVFKAWMDRRLRQRRKGLLQG